MATNFLATNILEPMENSATRFSEKPAFVSEHATLTYAQMLHSAKAVGSFLTARLPQKSTVAILMERDVWAIPAILGAIYAGCICAPLDPLTPADRIQKIFKTLQPAYILADDTADSILEELGALPCPVDQYADAAAEHVNKALLHARRECASVLDPVEIYYTSGSTGVPKGVVHTHRSMLFYANQVMKWKDLVNEHQVWGNQAPFYYSNAIYDIYPPIFVGATVRLIPNDCFLFPKLFVDYMNDKTITTILMTPMNYLYIADAGVLEPGCMPFLKSVFMCGEAVPYKQMRIWADAAPNADVYNFYGSTESPYMSLYFLGNNAFEPGDLVPSGGVTPGVRMLLLDENGEEVVPGEPGEIYAASPWLSSGYYRDPERTAAAFVSDPLGLGWNDVYYRTGDIGFFNKGGDLIVRGRTDTQIKHRGYRMDLGEVEAVLRSVEGCQNGCCLFYEEGDKLYCFWCGGPTEKTVRDSLSKRLEKYMLPNVYVRLEEYPRTLSGKLDRMALKQIYFENT